MDEKKKGLENSYSKVMSYLEELKRNSKSRIDDTNIERTQRTVEAGGDALANIIQLFEETSVTLDSSRKIMGGVNSIAAKKAGQEYDQGAVRALTRSFYGKQKSPLKKMLIVFRRNKEISIKDGLNILEKTVQKIPPFVGRLEAELRQRKDEFQDLKKDIRDKIECIIEERPELLKNVKIFEEKKTELQAQYDTLENQREEASITGICSSPETLDRLTKLDILLRKCDDGYREIKTREVRSKKNIELLNAHLRQITEYQGLLRKTDDVVSDAKNYVDIEVPTLQKQIRAQKSEIQSLGGVNEVLGFIEGTKVVSRETNTRIDYMAGFLIGKVGEIRQRAIGDADSIYALPPGTSSVPKIKKADEIIDVEFIVGDESE